MKADDCPACRALKPVLVALLLLLIPALAGCPSSDDPAHYIGKLQKDDEEVRRRAVEELVRMHKKAMPHVKLAVKSEDPNVRKGVAEFLVRVRRMESLITVGELIDDPDKDVRLKAIEAVAGLAHVWKAKSVELLARGFDGEDPECITLAGEGLRDMRHDGATDVLRERFQAGEGIQAIYAARFLYEMEPSAEISRPLLEGLIADDPVVRDAAKANARELRDRIVARLVEFIDGEAGTARATLVVDDIRTDMIDELNVTLDTKRAASLLDALGTIADAPSVEKLNSDLRATRLGSSWCVSAARGLATAALSPRISTALKGQAEGNLMAVMNDQKLDQRIRIGAAIALCRLRKSVAVEFLLGELDRFEEAVKEENISQVRLNDLTELRVSAQEALTIAGDFAVPFLMARLEDTQKRPGPIIIWAAAKTLGELKQEEAVPFLGEYLTSKKAPAIAVGPDGRVSDVATGLSEQERGEVSFLLVDATGNAVKEDWQELDDEQLPKVSKLVEEFAYPDYVRWTSAVGLGQIGGRQAVTWLRQAEELESGFLARLRKAEESRDYYMRADVIGEVVRRHEDVLFYVRKALQGLGEDA